LSFDQLGCVLGCHGGVASSLSSSLLLAVLLLLLLMLPLLLLPPLLQVLPCLPLSRGATRASCRASQHQLAVPMLHRLGWGMESSTWSQ
jgi:hypothetical protein